MRIRHGKYGRSGVLVEVIRGVHGHMSLCVDNRRIAGDKPWGGGHVIHKFIVPVDELRDVLEKAEKAERAEKEEALTIGDQVWWVDHGLAVQCTILDEVAEDGCTRFFRLDEPLGYYPAADELCLDEAEAREALAAWDGEGLSLEEFRRRKSATAESYPSKEKGVEWFVA